MLRILIIAIPFLLGAFAGGWMVAQGARRRYWAVFAVSAAAGTMPALRIADGAFGTRYGEAVRAWLSNTARCADIGCGFAGNIVYAIALAALVFAAGMLAGGAFARGQV